MTRSVGVLIDGRQRFGGDRKRSEAMRRHGNSLSGRRAIEALDEAVRTDLRNSSALIDLAAELYKQGERGLFTFLLLLRASELSPTSPEAFYGLSVMSYDFGKFSDSYTYAIRAIENGHGPDAHFYAAKAAEKTGKESRTAYIDSVPQDDPYLPIALAAIQSP